MSRAAVLLTQRLGSAAEGKKGLHRHTMSKLSADTLREGIAGSILYQEARKCLEAYLLARSWPNGEVTEESSLCRNL